MERLYYEELIVIQNGGTAVEKLLMKFYGLTMWMCLIANTNYTYRDNVVL
jgi:hypothetical protein